MNLVARTLVSLVTFSGLAAVAACGAPAESDIGSTSDALSVGVPILPPPIKIDPGPSTPPAPTWPAANATYCSANPGCDVFSDPGRLWTPVTSTELVALGCVGPFGLEGEPSHPTGITFAVCYDSAAVRAQYTVFNITCDTCLPALPAGEIYIDTLGPAARPNCPSGCPAPTPTPSPVHGGGGVGGGTKLN